VLYTTKQNDKIHVFPLAGKVLGNLEWEWKVMCVFIQ